MSYLPSAVFLAITIFARAPENVVFLKPETRDREIPAPRERATPEFRITSNELLNVAATRVWPWGCDRIVDLDGDRLVDRHEYFGGSPWRGGFYFSERAQPGDQELFDAAWQRYLETCPVV